MVDLLLFTKLIINLKTKRYTNLMENNKIKNVIFDLDETLIDFCDNLYDEVIPILNYLVDNEYKIYLCSHNEQGEKICNDLNIHHYFFGFSCGYKDSNYKLVNLAELPVSKEDSVFFDDFDEIIESCKKNGWNIIKVNPNNGITWRDIKKVFIHSTNKYESKILKESNELRLNRY